MLAATLPAPDSVRLTVEPRGVVIDAAPGALLLDVLRNARIPVSYSCEAGRCGTCRCELLAGDVAEQSGAEFRAVTIAGENRQVLACRTRLVGDCVIGLVESEDVVIHPAQTLKCRVESIQALNEVTLALRLRPNRPLRFSAGQFARLDFGGGRVRPYSMANAEGAELLEFHLRRVSGGVVTSFVAERLRAGDIVKLTGPLGTSYLRRKHQGPALCIAGGTGLAPICSIVRTALNGECAGPFHIYVGARNEAEHYCIDELRELQRQHPARLNLTVAADLQAADAAFRLGRVVDVAAADLTSLLQWKVYLAGPPPMVDAGMQLALRLAARPADIHADAFYPSET